MYTVAFYSFKGGVGRTMALVNIGVELAHSGNRVLMVDFDLEAPGLETFNLARLQPETPGIVDYVSRYVETGEAPDVGEYVYESPGVGSQGGRAWIMPAGRQDEAYAVRLNSIDWQRLYAEREGFLLFEDLKEQWKKLLLPHYVLIDSRTGHTDVGGICTRQLPDAVVILFFPNEQNLCGLSKVVADIRGEAAGPQKKDITLHFVTSNVPDLDDEDRILETRIQRFQKLLGYKELAGTIHHYDSLALLNQVVFSRDRPRSRLSAEYRRLTRVIVRENMEDRDGALALLEDLVRSPERTSASDLEQRLERVRALHPDDGEILYRLSRLREWQGLREDALALLNQALAAGYQDPAVFVQRAGLRADAGDQQGAVEDLYKLLETEGASFPEIGRAMRLLRRVEPQALRRVPDSAAVKALRFPERLQVAAELRWSRDFLPLGESILRELLTDRGRTVEEHDSVRNLLILCLIGQRRFREAMQLNSPVRPEVGVLSIQSAFNYAMAEWGDTGAVPRDLFRRVVELDAAGASRDAPNHNQCLAIASWAVGDLSHARERVNRARRQIGAPPRREFSAWRYLEVTPAVFEKDLDEVMRMFDGEAILPAFMTAVS